LKESERILDSNRNIPAILLFMPQDPLEEWRRLSKLYGEMGDLEIQELAGQLNDLTPNAQQVLRDELKKRAISTEPSATPVQRSPNNAASVHWQLEQDTAADHDLDSSEDEESDGYTWKVALCRCESLDQASARCEMLRRAGVDSWIQRPESRFVVPWLETGVGDIQINVAADQLDQAQTIAAQPIPQDIMDQLKAEAAAPEYEIPTCPKCKAPDPTLESVEPSNNWLCESCGYTWSDPILDTAEQQAPHDR
jgi:hypothetical protein